jgi:hypothetical protein
MVVLLFNTVMYVFLLLCLCILIVCFMYLHRASWHSSATLTEVFPCFFLSCKANARVKRAKMGGGGTARTLPNFLCCSMYCLFCVVLCTACV